MALYDDFTMYGKSGEKKRISVFSTPTMNFITDDVINGKLFTLPPHSIIDSVYLITEAGATVETFDIKIGTIAIAEYATVGALGTDEVVTTKPYFEAGGDVTIVGSDAISTAVSFRVVVTYLELETGSGFRTK